MRWSRSDIALARRAARERWGVPDSLKTELLYQAAETLVDPESSTRDRIAWSKLMVEADKSDQRDDHHADKQNLEQQKFDHQTKAPEAPEDDYQLDISQDDPA